MTINTRQAGILFKIETTEGDDAAPSNSADGILVENVKLGFNPNVIDTSEVTPSLDPFDKIVGGMSVPISFDMYLKGSGTPETAPEWGKVLKCCGWAETVTNAAVPASPEALASGASMTLATLGATAAGTAEAYRGMPISFTGGQALDSFISDYTAGKVATLVDKAGGNLTTDTNYQILKNVLYAPASVSIPSATIWYYLGGLLYKLTGCRGNVSFNLAAGGPGKMSFSFMGQFESKTDAALPTITYNATRPPVWKNGRLTLNALQIAAQTLSLDMGAKTVQPENPNATEGFDPAIITARAPQGSINPCETLVATRNIMDDFRTQTKGRLHGRFGSTAGNRIAVTIPSALYLNQTPGDRNGYAIVDVPFHATGQDAGAFICSY